jgi:hypothetical protein
MAQNWNNIVNFVKANLGTKHSSIELTDDEFVNYFKEQSLPYFSQIIPLQHWILVTGAHLINTPNMYSQHTYKLPIPENLNLIDVACVYMTDHSENFLNDTFYTNPADLVMANTFNDMNQFLKSVNDYQFIKPDYLRFSDEPSIDTFIVELNIEHSNLNTIPGDMYHKLFKQICLVDAYELVINNRNKYNNLTTPFGNIDLNIDYMTQRSQELRQKIDDIIDNLPHREYLEIF